MGNLAVILTFQLMLGGLGVGGSYALYAALNLLALGFVYKLVVETKRRSLADIQRLITSSPRISVD